MKQTGTGRPKGGAVHQRVSCRNGLGVLCACLVAVLAVAARGMESLLPPDLARAYTVRKWTLDDGLPDSLVCGVVPGRDGYLWLATARYLVRFDGLRFVPVAMPAQSSVGRNEGLFQDSSGGLWLYGFLGAVRYADGAWWQSEAAGMPCSSELQADVVRRNPVAAGG